MNTDPQAVELVKEAVKAGMEGLLAPYKDIMTQALGPFADSVGGSFALYGQQWRLEREAAFWNKYKRLMDRLNRKPNPVPPKTFFPLLHQAFLEDDDGLQERWAALLASATTAPGSYTPIFTEILRSLTGVEIGVLDALFEEFLGYYRQGYAHLMPVHAAADNIQVGDEESVADHLIKLGHLQAAQWQDLFTMGSPLSNEGRFDDLAKLHIVLDSLMRNQLIRYGTPRPGRKALWLTTLGTRFLEASRPASRDNDRAESD
jgi:hypothetical protein